MNLLLIGSKAAKLHYPEFRDVSNKDLDWIGTAQDIAQWVEENLPYIKHHRLKEDRKLFLKTGAPGNAFSIEMEIAAPGSSAEAFLKANRGNELASPASLWLLKMSHVRHPIHWRKNIEDYHFFKSKNLKPTPEEWQAYEMRKAEVDARFKDRKINLNMKNEDFFKKSSKIGRVYEHDDLHRVTCYYDKPLYDTLKKDQSKALIDKDLWLALSHQDKLRTVREECYAIALERKIIPAMNAGNPPTTHDAQEAFMYALQRVCTTLTKGWFKEFSIECYPEIKCVDRDYVGLFLTAIASGQIRSL